MCPRRPFTVCLLAVLTFGSHLHGQEISRPAPKPPFDVPDGARILMLGDAFFEREIALGYIETALTSRFHDRKLTFRNLGWTGDTVWGDSRAGFDTAGEGFQRRAALVAELKPDIILIAYGMNESFEGQNGLARFVEGYKKLLDSVEPTKAKIVLISPIFHEDLGPPLPDPNAHNRDLVSYRHAIERIASERGHVYADMYSYPSVDGNRLKRTTPRGTTDDGIHLSPYGYRRMAGDVASAISSGFPYWSVGLRGNGQFDDTVVPTRGTRLADIEVAAPTLRFRSNDDTLPMPPPQADMPAPLDDTFRSLVVHGLSPGRYMLKIDGRQVAAGNAEAWAKGVILRRGPEFDQAEALRRAIIEKNALLFHRLRPQNETYLYLFRKHEQGHMAKEVPQFDPLVAEKEAEIDRLKKPVPHTYELIRVKEEK